ncbi:Hypothetical protein; putative Ferrochelatase (Protoheme ferro-lyase) (Heme synthetase) [Frankia alni ACN14a]|uniref:Uncharacterized protein n=1 Tax=Frankia alni (strain DSM 45986 / CECT 9034 / ACN14a) TaxID=326424 RepID=Q0RES1_FRAAA|nr:Hypothetical protein; putative Ferrochelatase (Protoheme ferro-lyase) (Heme synthetase) [Frankia alni ACN14a]
MVGSPFPFCLGNVAPHGIRRKDSVSVKRFGRGNRDHHGCTGRARNSGASSSVHNDVRIRDASSKESVIRGPRDLVAYRSNPRRRHLACHPGTRP